MKVVVAVGDERFVEELRGDFPDVDFEYGGNEEQQMGRVRDADVYYGWPSRKVFLAAERLRWLQNPGTGIDRIANLPELIDSDVVLTNFRGPHANPMADHVIGMMVSLAHRMGDFWDDQKAHRWEPQKYHDSFAELSGRTMGILSLGGIGLAVARRANGFGMEVYAVDRHPRPDLAEGNTVWGLDRLDELLSISDWFVVTAPLTPETRGLIDRRRMGLLKQGAHVIVISRGNIIDEDALIEGLRTGRIAGAGLDVMAEEPLPEDSPLWDMKNVVLSPHASALTREMGEGRRELFKENLRRFLANEPFLYVCDKTAGF
jgi:phosphoglycerate dehydrogenase-like enzyme